MKSFKTFLVEGTDSDFSVSEFNKYAGKASIPYKMDKKGKITMAESLPEDETEFYHETKKSIDSSISGGTLKIVDKVVKNSKFSLSLAGKTVEEVYEFVNDSYESIFSSRYDLGMADKITEKDF